MCTFTNYYDKSFSQFDQILSGNLSISELFRVFSQLKQQKIYVGRLQLLYEMGTSKKS